MWIYVAHFSIYLFDQLIPTFTKNPSHGVFHRIETNGPPCKAKPRPIIANADKARKGKEAWDKMLQDGIIEEVKPGANTDFSSALHLANKPGGGVRPVRISGR